MTEIHQFAGDDPRARIDWQGEPYRATTAYIDGDHGLSVWLIRVTKRDGADFKRPNSGLWLTVEGSLERFPQHGGADLAVYVRELHAAHVCDNDSLAVTPQRSRTKPSKVIGAVGRCRICKRVWRQTTDGRSWYDPAEGADPTAPHESASTPAETQPSDEDMQRWADRQFYGHA